MNNLSGKEFTEFINTEIQEVIFIKQDSERIKNKAELIISEFQNYSPIRGVKSRLSALGIKKPIEPIEPKEPNANIPLNSSQEYYNKQIEIYKGHIEKFLIDRKKYLSELKEYSKNLETYLGHQIIVEQELVNKHTLERINKLVKLKSEQQSLMERAKKVVAIMEEKIDEDCTHLINKAERAYTVAKQLRANDIVTLMKEVAKDDKHFDMMNAVSEIYNMINKQLSKQNSILEERNRLAEAQIRQAEEQTRQQAELQREQARQQAEFQREQTRKQDEQFAYQKDRDRQQDWQKKEEDRRRENEKSKSERDSFYSNQSGVNCLMCGKKNGYAVRCGCGFDDLSWRQGFSEKMKK